MKMLVQCKLATVFLIVTFLSACGGKEVKEVRVQTVKTELVKKNIKARELVYPGKVVSRAESNLSYRIAGPIEKINVELGQHVQKGQVLAVLDQRDYKIQFSATEAEYEQIKAQAERAMELFKRGSATPSDYDKAFYGLKQITAKYNAHKNALEDTELKAPYSGYITKINFKANETVGAGMPVISMISDDLSQMEIFISSADFVRIKEMEKFSAAIDVYPDTIFPLELLDVAKKANLNQLFSVKFAVKEVNGISPAAGMSANVHIEFKRNKADEMLIPYSAVFSEDGQSLVWVLKDNKVNKRQITVYDVNRSGIATVTDGLQEGEIVVSAGVHHLSENEEVRVLAPKSPTNIGNVL